MDVSGEEAHRRKDARIERSLCYTFEESARCSMGIHVHGKPVNTVSPQYRIRSQGGLTR